MKKLTLSIAVLFSGMAPSLVYAKSPINVVVPAYEGRFTLGVSGFYLRPSLPELDYALTYPVIQFSGTTPITVFENGSYRSVDPNYDWGYELFAGYEIPCSGADIRIDFRHLDAKDDKSAIAPAILGTLVDLTFFNGSASAIALIVDELTSNTLTSSSRGSSEFDYDIGDIEYGQSIQIGCATKVRFFEGVRLARLQHKFHANYVQHQDAVSGAIGPFTTDTSFDVFQNSKFNGAGPLLGLKLDYRFCSGLGITGRTSSALLVGGDKSSYLRHHFEAVDSVIPVPTVDETFTFKFPKETRVVPNLEARLGLNLGFHFCNPSRTEVMLEVGWLVDHYWNAVDRLSDINVETPEFRTRHTLGTSFDGPYASLSVRL